MDFKTGLGQVSIMLDIIWTSMLSSINCKPRQNTGWFWKGVKGSGSNKIVFYWSLKVVLLDIQNSKVYNFIHMTRYDQRS